MNTYLISSNKGVSNTIKSICDKYDVKVLTIDIIEGVNENWWNEKIHALFIENKIERIVIPVSMPENNSNYFGLEIGMHIRLDYMIPVEDRCIPIVFFSDLSFNNLVTSCPKNSSSNPHLLLLTKGVSVCDVFDLSSILSTESEGLSTNEYQSFLRQLNVNRKDTMGNHDIANAWGCYKLAQFVGGENSIFINSKLSEKLGQIYAKWMICLNNAFTNIEVKDIAPSIPCKGKKILYIDDKADEGWGELLKYMFKKAGEGFVCVDPAKYKVNNVFDFNGFNKECESYIGQRWDLVIVDLRLNPDSEDLDTSEIMPNKLSGYNLIDKFLKCNAGYQIIVFTASNKIWNIDAALKRGARGYYIKESPVYTQDLNYYKQTIKNTFLLNVEKCFANSFLYDIYDSIQLIEKRLPHNDFGDDVYNQLDIAFELISSADSEEKYAYAYVSLYMVIEIINKYLVRKKDGKWILPNGTPLHKYTSSKGKYNDNGRYQEEKDPSQHSRITGLILQEWKIYKPEELLDKLRVCINKRSDFIHNSRLVSDDNLNVFNKESFIELFDLLKRIIDRLYGYNNITL